MLPQYFVQFPQQSMGIQILPNLGTKFWYPTYVILLQLLPVLHGQQETGPQFCYSNKTEDLSFPSFAKQTTL